MEGVSLPTPQGHEAAIAELRCLFKERDRECARAADSGEDDERPEQTSATTSEADFSRRYSRRALLSRAAAADSFVASLVTSVKELAAMLASDEHKELRVCVLDSLSAALEWFAGARRTEDVVESARGLDPRLWLADGTAWLLGLQRGLCAVLAAKAAGEEVTRSAVVVASLAAEVIGQAALLSAGGPQAVSVCVVKARVELHVCLSEALRLHAEGGEPAGTVKVVAAAARLLELAVNFLCDEEDEFACPEECRWRNLPPSAIVHLTSQLTEAYSDLLRYFDERAQATTDVDVVCVPLLRCLAGELEDASLEGEAAAVRQKLEASGVSL
eukprot:TRINITY_DN47104_c0_g1_i1.p1 TRINITY_DN47104_c0_g1~~TRINITY_DN47104_c0_g1_i1.p1  ORF type:complete len:350 (+),score=128.95 TRINITY_DN47104_c0_g1_i1:65-1051(+)